MASIHLFKPPCAIGSVPSLSGHAIAYRWRSLSRVHRHSTNRPRGSLKWMLTRQVTMDQLICASLPHTHYWVSSGRVERTDIGRHGNHIPDTVKVSINTAQVIEGIKHTSITYMLPRRCANTSATGQRFLPKTPPFPVTTRTT